MPWVEAYRYGVRRTRNKHRTCRHRRICQQNASSHLHPPCRFSNKLVACPIWSRCNAIITASLFSTYFSLLQSIFLPDHRTAIHCSNKSTHFLRLGHHFLYRPISLSLNTGSLFCHFAHLRRQRRHACGGNVPEYAPAPLGLASLYLHQTGKKARFAPYFALRAQYGLFIALFRYRSIRARGATAMCSGVPPLRAYACAAVLCARYAVRIRTAFSSKTSHARMHNRLSHNNHRPSDGALSRHLDVRRRHSTVAYSRG